MISPKVTTVLDMKCRFYQLTSYNKSVSRHDTVLARRYFVRGRVQGVGFRWFIEKHANDIGVKGWTRNRDDGSVEVYAVGTKNQLDRLSASLYKGPPMAEVRGVEETEAALEKVSGFRISH
jgi:acylphosphatase